jgi:hypothetical protein
VAHNLANQRHQSEYFERESAGPLDAEINDVMMAGGSAAAGCSPDEFGKIPI